MALVFAMMALRENFARKTLVFSAPMEQVVLLLKRAVLLVVRLIALDVAPADMECVVLSLNCLICVVPLIQGVVPNPHLGVYVAQWTFPSVAIRAMSAVQEEHIAVVPETAVTLMKYVSMTTRCACLRMD